jgi:zinc protease
MPQVFSENSCRRNERKEAHHVNSAHHYIFPPIREEHLPNGLTVLLVEDHQQEGLTIALQMPFGEFCDTEGLEGTTELAIGMLLKGPLSLTPEEFSDRIEHIGAALFSEVGDEHCVLGCRLLARHAPEVVSLFWEMVTRPGFRTSELVRLKREMSTGLQAETADPMSIANRHFTTLLCGNVHPAGRVQTGRSVKRVSLSDVTSFYNTFFSADGAVVVLAGDFDTREMLSLASPLFSAWSAPRKKPPVTGGPLSPRLSTDIRLVDKPDLSQVSLIIGHPVPGELHEKRNQLALANYIIGGGNFSSRLMEHIRSKEGKTYGISSQLSCNRNFGVFTMATSTQNSQAAGMLASIMTVYRDVAERGVTGEELTKAKQFAAGNMSFQLEGIVNVADKLLWLRQFGRDISYIENFNDMIESISLDSVNEAIRASLSSQHFAIAAVGRKKVLRDTLAGYGQVRIVNFRDDPL